MAKFTDKVSDILCIIVAILIIIMLIIFAFILDKTIDDINSPRDHYQIEFARKIMHAIQEGNDILLSDLIISDWDRVYVFSNYATIEDKYNCAGYKYDKTLINNDREGAISLLFMNGNKVTYFVDALWYDKYEFMEMSVGNWRFFPGFEVASFEEHPVLSFEKQENFTDIYLNSGND